MSPAEVEPATPPSGWAPLRRPVFRALWLAQFVANTGTWMQTVGAQWLMGDLGGGALAVALIQAATTLPVFLLVVPAGALGDILDRRRLLLTGQALMCAGAAGITLTTAFDRTTPALLLGWIAVTGVGQALSVPSFQAIQPELVSRGEVPQAAVLNGVNVNVARAVGPAVGGLLIAATGPASTFAFNTLSFLGVLAVLYRWRRPPDHRPLGAEHVAAATRAGARYILNAPRFATVLMRSALFMIFASCLWALLPAVARGPLRLGADGYGVLLAAVGIGAVAGAFAIGRLRAAIGANAVVSASTVAYGGAVVVIGAGPRVALVLPALVVAGAAWIGVQSTLNATAQALLPAWTRARALAYFQLVFMGGQTLGAIGWGMIAGLSGLRAAFIVPGCALLLTAALTVRRFRLPRTSLDLSRMPFWPEPAGGPDSQSGAGPVLVEVQWRVPQPNAEAFVDAMLHVSRSRKRTGATLWGLFRDVSDPSLYVETFTVATWHEHLRQHFERGTVWDRELEAAARALTEDGADPVVRHLIWAGALRPSPDHRV
ncbi:MFS transporter [Actinoplanes sp. LDG1-01]|uniref:MFS transporter n=1 Tax=Paractinoplanes lichenicola TaxID=2802976 RepID=A0ABS1W0Q1_9ACTN|nr:MFS transporter [Actinoplanes lichenicola]